MAVLLMVLLNVTRGIGYMLASVDGEREQWRQGVELTQDLTRSREAGYNV